MSDIFLRIIGICTLFCLLSFPCRSDAADSARVYIEALAAGPGDVDLRLQYALFLSRNGALIEATKQAERVLKQAPEYWDAHLLLGRIAGWQRDFNTALRHVNTVLDHDRQYPGAVLLKIDLLRWMQDHRTMMYFLNDLVRRGEGTAEIYGYLAEAEYAEQHYLRAYRNAEKALRLDPKYLAARNLMNETRRVSLQLVEELEYYDFDGAEASPDKKGGGFIVAATAFPNARFSATVTESVRYRFRTFNHQIALRGEYKPKPFLGIALMGAVGAPAEVIPKGTVMAAVRGEMFKVMDATLSTIFDVSAWPKEEPAFLVRPTVAVGFLVHPRVRLGAAYTLGLLTFCGRAPQATHSGALSASWSNETVTLNWAGGYAEERDPLAVGVTPPSTCGEIAALETDRGESFSTAEIRILHVGAGLVLRLGPRSSLLTGYRFERKETEPYHNIIPAHISHFGLSVWF